MRTPRRPRTARSMGSVRHRRLLGATMRLRHAPARPMVRPARAGPAIRCRARVRGHMRPDGMTIRNPPACRQSVDGSAPDPPMSGPEACHGPDSRRMLHPPRQRAPRSHTSRARTYAAPRRSTRGADPERRAGRNDDTAAARFRKRWHGPRYLRSWSWSDPPMGCCARWAQRDCFRPVGTVAAMHDPTARSPDGKGRHP
jgi:hypothetical protein